MKKLIFLYLLLTVNFSIAQHEQDSNSDDSMNLIFSTQQLDFSAEVLSDSEKLITDKKFLLYLNLTSAFTIDSASVKLNLNSNNGKVQKINNLKKQSTGSYRTSVLIREPGSYQFIFSLTLKDSLGNPKEVRFSFSKDVESADKIENHENGLMGMSTAMMIIMGAAMVVMMAVIFATGGSHK